MRKAGHLASERNLDIFINGNLVKRHTLEGIPKQNYGDVNVMGSL